MAETTAITKEDAAEKLDGCQYREEGSPELFAAMKAAGLVAVFGASDDLVEFRGAIDDERGASSGATIHLTASGLLRDDCDDDRCPHCAKEKKAAATITVKWSTGGFSWRYETAIPHTKFVIGENDERYCEGIVFALKDVPPLDLSTAVEG